MKRVTCTAMKMNVHKLLAKLLFISLICLMLMSSSLLAQDTALVTKVIDGKTLELESGEIVRLIGIETGDEAYQYTRKMVEDKSIRLEFDAHGKDEKGRTLAYVYVKSRFNPEIGDYDDDYPREVFLNAELIKKGYATPAAGSANVKYKDLFQQLYQKAQQKKRSFWD